MTGWPGSGLPMPPYSRILSEFSGVLVGHAGWCWLSTTSATGLPPRLLFFLGYVFLWAFRFHGVLRFPLSSAEATHGLLSLPGGLRGLHFDVDCLCSGSRVESMERSRVSSRSCRCACSLRAGVPAARPLRRTAGGTVIVAPSLPPLLHPSSQNMTFKEGAVFQHGGGFEELRKVSITVQPRSVPGRPEDHKKVRARSLW